MCSNVFLPTVSENLKFGSNFFLVTNRPEFHLKIFFCDNGGVQLTNMASSRDVYSEDDNFLIGDDFNTDRYRREARQLHLSQFRTTRREAHFARYRNSFLKCDLERTNDRIEQARRLRLTEMERARAAIVKQLESRRRAKRYSLNGNDGVSSATDGKPIILVNNISPSREAKMKSKDRGNDSRPSRQTHRGFLHNVTNLSMSRASSVTGERGVCDFVGEREQAISSLSMGDGKGNSLSSDVDKQQASEVDPSLNTASAYGKEPETRGSFVSESRTAWDSEGNLPAKSSSTKASNGKTLLLNRRKNSAASFQESHTKKTKSQSAHERWVWTEFDKIMKGFADFLQIEHKSVKLRNEAAVDQDTKTRPPPNITLNSRNTLSPFYFRYGVSDQIAFRF